MKPSSLLGLAMAASIAISGATAFARTYNSSSSSSSCNTTSVLCIEGTTAQCINNQWQCVPNSSSSSSSSTDKCIAHCPDGYEYRTCTEDGHVIYYFADPCMNHYSSSYSSPSPCGQNNLMCIRTMHAECKKDGTWSCVENGSSNTAGSCGPNTVRCRAGWRPVCTAAGTWICQAHFSSSSSSKRTCSGPSSVLCAHDKDPVCRNGEWTCVPGHSSSSVSDIVRITALQPDAGPTHMKVTIEGTGFAHRGNMVRFAESVLPHQVSRDGRHITFHVPTHTMRACFRMKTRCMIPMRKYGPGTYDVSVTVKHETSNSVPFTIR